MALEATFQMRISTEDREELGRLAETEPRLRYVPESRRMTSLVRLLIDDYVHQRRLETAKKKQAAG